MNALLVLPTYNEKENIANILRELLKQPSLDILVVDDNSPDNTAQIVKNIQAREPRVFFN
ncbi:glycosyltransferase [Desulfonauticus submarinus]